MYLANQRAGTHSTLRRGEVAGSTKKLFRQKGTGNARVGTKPHQQAPRRRHRQGPQAARLRIPPAQEGRPRRHPHGHPEQVPGQRGRHHRRPRPARGRRPRQRRQAMLKALEAEARRDDLPDRDRRRRQPPSRRRRQDGLRCRSARRPRPALPLGPEHPRREGDAGDAVQRLHGAAAEAAGPDAGRPGRAAQGRQARRPRPSDARGEEPQPWRTTRQDERRTRGPKLEPHQIVLRPLVTEKGTHQSTHRNAYPFEVNPWATKDEIKAAVEELFGVQRREGAHAEPPRQDSAATASRIGKLPNWKKAIVTLHAGQPAIEFF